MAHEHSHSHAGHSHAPASFNTAFAIGVALNAGYVVFEAIFGVMGHSLALVADAGHNLTDVLGLLLAWCAGAMAKSLPTKIQRLCRWKLTTAGPSERAGFIDAPQIGPANIASNPMTDPTTIPAVIPFSRAPVETPRITNINNAVRISSRTKDWVRGPAAIVAPSVTLAGKRNRKTTL